MVCIVMLPLARRYGHLRSAGASYIYAAHVWSGLGIDNSVGLTKIVSSDLPCGFCGFPGLVPAKSRVPTLSIWSQTKVGVLIIIS